MTTLGDYTLSLAVLVAALTILASLAAVRFQSDRILLAAKAGMGVFSALLLLASIALLAALLDDQFQIVYVARFSEKALPTGYKFAAFWAGQEGSLLLWAFMLAIMSTIAVLVRRQISLTQAATEVAVLAVVCGFFAALMLFAANPFATSEVVPLDGHGLNPMLQNFGMIAHPPALFLGYAGFTIPFAMMVAALVCRRTDNIWIAATRRWALLSWLFLSIGIILGAQWAYVELGWGGYWAWDPVENASLLPWLTATAFVHSLMAQQHRGMFKGWNAVLIAETFILCIFGTYLTRSGIVDSVHSFGQSLVGTFFFVFLCICITFSIVLLIVRRRELKSEHPLEGLVGREGAFLITNVLLTIIMATTLVGTIFPAISKPFTGTQTTLGQPFYNKVVAPMGLALVALMAVGPLLRYGRDSAEHLARGILLPALVAGVTVIVMVAMRIMNPWALSAAAIIATALAAMSIELFKAVREHVREQGERPIPALLRLIDANHRRYGGQIVHLGMLMIIAGVTGSSVFSQKQSFQLSTGQSQKIGSYRLTLDSMKEVRGGNYTAVRATVTMRDASGKETTLTPERRFYNKAEQPATEVSIQTTWREDFYVILAGWEENWRKTAIEAIINPLVVWIWIGGIVMTLGGILCIVPRLSSKPLRAVAVEDGARIGAGRQTVGA
ncbi:MAG TPA: heme lyase CcmF/NrfE family subunit [Tepidisphaeraceae bacterium]|jgi:cytochrome c-type biogenesis protein CcmF